MIHEKKLVEIAGKLLARTKENEIQWQKGDDTPYTQKYYYKLPTSIIVIQYHSPEVQLDSYELLLLGDRGQVAANVEAEEGSKHFPILKELFLEAHRTESGWDQVLAEVEGFLNMAEK